MLIPASFKALKFGENSNYTELIVSTVIILFIASTVIPSVSVVMGYSQKTICINNLRMIEQAKDGYALEQGIPEGEEVSVEQIERFLKKASNQLHCPSTPSENLLSCYVINPIGTSAQCRRHLKDHSL